MLGVASGTVWPRPKASGAAPFALQISIASMNFRKKSVNTHFKKKAVDLFVIGNV